MEDKALGLLNEILREPLKRIINVSKFIKLVEDNEDKATDEFWRTASDLANSLNFYEPDPEFREQDPSLYGEDKLEAEVRRVLEKLTEIR